MTLSTRKQLRDTVLHMWDGFTDQSFYESTLAAVGDAAYASNSFTVSGAGSVTFTSVTLSDFTVSGFVTLDAFGGELVGGSDSISFPNSTTIRATIDSVNHDWTVAALSTGVEYHVLITRTGSTLTLYLDNASQGTKTASADVTFSDAFDGADGSFADIRIRKVATTAGFVSLLYNKGVAGFEPFLNLGGESLSIQPSRYSGSGDLLDESGNGNDLTLPSGYSVADGVISSDGTANGPDTGVGFSGQAASAGMWVKSTDDAVVLLYDTSSRFALCWQDGSSLTTFTGASNITVYVDGVAITDSRQVFHDAVTDGQWHHIAVTGDFTAGWATNVIGQWSTTATFRYTGELDDIRLEAGRKWSAEEIKLLASARGVELPNTRDAKLAVLPSYDDASNGGTSTIDYSGNQNTGTLTNGPTWNTSNNEESGARSIEFDTVNDLLETTYSSPTGAGVQSWSGWIYPTATSETADFIETRGTNASNGQGWRWSFYETGGSEYIFFRHGGGNIRYPIPGLNQWIHLAIVVPDGATNTDDVLVYVDGVQTAGVRNAGSDVALAIAHEFNARFGAAGQLQDDWLVHERQITPGEIARFSERRNIFGAAPVVTPGTWKIDILLFS